MRYNRIMALLLLFSLLFCLSGCQELALNREVRENLSEQVPEDVSGDTAEDEPEDAAEVQEAAEGSSIYDQLYNAIWNGEASCRVNGASMDEVQETLTALMDCPELFWIDSYGMQSYTLAGKPAYVDVSFHWCYADVPAKRAEVEAVTQEVAAVIPADASDYEKAKQIHNYLVTHITYGGEEDSDGQDIYAALVRGRCVCNGYAKSYEYLLDQVGVECQRIAGTADGESHSWNRTVLDGIVCYTDVTWDDMELFGENGQEYISYDWFNLTLEEMSRRHTPNPETPALEAGSQERSYYAMENAWLDRWSAEAVEEIFSAQAGNGTGLLTLRCRSEECYDAAWKALLEQQEIYGILDTLDCAASSIRYFYDDSLYILTFVLPEG